MKSLIQMESLWHDGLYIKIYNKFLNVQVNKATFFFIFSPMKFISITFWRP